MFLFENHVSVKKIISFSSGERVWVYLEAKNIPYKERLINLQNKPEWYKDLVPTTLVPAIVIHDDIILNQTTKEGEVIQPERRVIWESSKIIEVLDDLFDKDENDKNIKLVLGTEEYKKAEEMNTELGTAGFQYIYSSRNTSLTTEDIQQRKDSFEAKLDELDQELLAHGGPFRLGKEFTVLDALMVPMLERWKYQLPITSNINILSGRKGLQNWFDAMDSYKPYSNRVAGDEYSWTAVASYFLKLFNSNGTNVSDETKDAMLRADNAAMALENSFVGKCNKLDELGQVEKIGKAKLLAADKIITNYEAIIKDCTNSNPKTQVHIPRATNEQSVDLLLRYVVHTLLQSTTMNQTLEKVIAGSCSSMLVDLIEDKYDASVAARTIARRLCIPRDMGALSGTFLRGVLSMVATSLEK